MRDQLLAAEVAQRVLELHRLDEQVVLGIQAVGRLRALEVERQPLLHAAHPGPLREVGEDGEVEHDPLYEDGVRLVVEFGKASTSLLQRRLRIGYGRAAHLIDLMERDGIVGAADGPKPREVLKRPTWLAEVEESLR